MIKNYDQFLKYGAISLITTVLFVPTINISLAQETQGVQGKVDFFAVGEKPFGRGYEDYVKDYWKLFLSIPADSNPFEDQTGEKCTYGQNNTKNVFFLTGNSGGKTVKNCQIPAGLSLLIPIITVEASQAETPGATIDELHKIAKNDQDHVTSLYLKINGTEITHDDLLKYRIHTGDFDIEFPDNAIFGAGAGPSKAVADGYYVITKPLSPGAYNIEFSGSIACLGADCVEPSFITHNIYNLVVK